MLPAISASTLDGFAVGMLLSGGVFLLVTAHVQSGGRFGRAGAPQLAGAGLAEFAGAAASADGGDPGDGGELGDYPLPAPVGTDRLDELVTALAAGPSATATPAVLMADAMPGADIPAGTPAEVTADSVAVIPADVPAAAASAAVLTMPGSSAAGDLLTPADADELPAVPDQESGPDDERGTPRRAAGYQSRHRLSGSEEARPWPASDGRRHAARHAAPTSASLARRMAALVPVRMAASSHRAA